MDVAHRINELVAKLPPARQSEVLDFIEFLTMRHHGYTEELTSWTEETFQDLAVLGLASDDDDPVTYDLSDCKEVR